MAETRENREEEADADTRARDNEAHELEAEEESAAAMDGLRSRQPEETPRGAILKQLLTHK